jgi:hypothetical protein
MAIKLVTEVMDWAPPLTHREHKVLMILAENARLPSRETWDSVESPRILRRARLTRAQMYAVIAELVKKGCLDKPVWGGRNHRAKYAIAHLAVPRPGSKAAWAAYLARLSPGERQAVSYSGWWTDHDHDQCQGKPDTENHDQRPGLQDTEKPRSASRKVRPRLPSSTGRGKAGLECAAPRSRPRAWAPRRGSGGTTPAPAGVQAATPLQSLRDHNGPEPDGPDVQQIPIEVHRQSQATDRNAREATP